MEGGTALTRVTRTAPALGPATAGRVAGGTHTHALTRMSWVESPEQSETGSVRMSSVGVRVLGEVLREVSGPLPVEPVGAGKGCVLYLEVNRKALERFKISCVLEKSLRPIQGLGKERVITIVAGDAGDLCRMVAVRTG